MDETGLPSMSRKQESLTQSQCLSSTEESVQAGLMRQIYVKRCPLEEELGVIDDDYDDDYMESDSSMGELTQNAINSPTKENGKLPRTSKFHQNILFVRMHQWTGIQSNGKLSNFEAMMTIVKYYLSVGILALPQMFFFSGFVLGSLILVIVTAASVYSIQLLLEVNQDIYEKDNQSVKQFSQLGDLCQKVLGPNWRMVQRNFSAMSNFGSCIAYLIFFEMYLSSLINDQWSHLLTEEQTHLIAALFAFVLILPLSAINNVSMFSQTNFIGVFFGVLALAIMIYRDFQLIFSTGLIERKDNQLWKIDNIGFALGICVYCLKISGIAMVVRGNMATPSSFQKVFSISTYMTTILYLVFGIVTQLALGEYVQGVAILNFSAHTFTGFVMRLAYLFSILLSYPLKFFLLVQIIENMPTFKDAIFNVESFEVGKYKDAYEHQCALLKRYAFRYILVASIFVVTLFSMRLSSFLALIGSLGGITNQFIIPQLLHLRHFKETLSPSKKRLGWTIILVSIAASIIGLIHSIQKIRSRST